MTMRKMALIALSLSLAAVPSAALAGWKVMPQKQAAAVAKSSLTVTPKSDWNRWSSRPSKKGEIWTLDGVSLNELSFFAGIEGGEAIYKERNKKDKPLPKFDPKMALPDIVQIFEASNRIILETPLFKVDQVEPAKLAGHNAVRFTYEYTVKDEEVRRKGEARAAVIGGKLYLINFAAPAIHYYDAGVDEARAIMDSAKL
jgi:hypothetical protein